MGNPKKPAENSQRAANPAKKPRGEGKPFQPGQSGNPGGRPKLPEDVKHVRELARQYTLQALTALKGVMDSGSGPARVSAAKEILDRAWGKSEQPLTGPNGGPIQTDNKTTVDVANLKPEQLRALASITLPGE